MTIRNNNGAITVSDIIAGRVVSRTYMGHGVHAARRMFAAYVRSHCGERFYA